MQITYFLASSLQSTILKHFLCSPKRWASFINNDLYLFLLLYNQTIYLVKELPTFPLPIEQWQQTTRNMKSLLVQTFLYPQNPPILLLACSQFQILSLEELFKKETIKN
ncbi:hypothetical protein [Chlamydia sp. 17-3921]|uniref:hypothetical protein n=1 Tax=Chlamydia sp. 17-3921 TaxID=2675798 RepID=UPI0019198A70|nr:hypothetical protein [Chlamydia sp. 17-3921]